MNGHKSKKNAHQCHVKQQLKNQRNTFAAII